MNIGMSTARGAGVDALMGVIQLMDTLNDPAKRASVFGEFLKEHEKLEKARAAAEAKIADAVALMHEKAREVDQGIAAAKQKAENDLAATKAEADKIVADARALAEQKMAAVQAEATKVAGERSLAAADKAEAEKAFAQARDLADAAAADRAAAEKTLAEAKHVQAENEAKARKIAAALA